MSNLLSIEQSFLALPQVKEALNLTEINRAKRSLANAQKKKYEQSLKMAALVNKSVQWYESDEGKEMMREDGISWSKADFGLKVFGWQKSFFYKLIKVANLDERIVRSFDRVCEEQGEDAKRSIAGLLEYSRSINVEDLPEDATEEEIDAAIEAAIEESEAEAAAAERVPTIITLSFKNPDGKNVAWRIDANGTIATHNTSEQVREVLEMINANL